MDEPLPGPGWWPGGCHCGAVRFSVRLDGLQAIRCNCSICAMKGLLHHIIPPDRFRLESGDSSLSTYRFNTRIAEHRFCKRCGVQPFYRPRSHPDMIDVNLHCLDGGLPEGLEIRNFDGKNWEARVHEIR